MTREEIDIMMADVEQRLKALRKPGQMWRGHLSSSAISTSVSIFALHKIDAERFRQQIEQGLEWLTNTMQSDGSWGDSVESPSNMTATLLSYTSLYALGAAPEATKRYLEEKFGGIDDEHLVRGVLDY